MRLLLTNLILPCWVAHSMAWPRCVHRAWDIFSFPLTCLDSCTVSTASVLDFWSLVTIFLHSTYPYVTVVFLNFSQKPKEFHDSSRLSAFISCTFEYSLISQIIGFPDKFSRGGCGFSLGISPLILSLLFGPPVPSRPLLLNYWILWLWICI